MYIERRKFLKNFECGKCFENSYSSFVNQEKEVNTYKLANFQTKYIKIPLALLSGKLLEWIQSEKF